jgi:DNA mismatch repair protein MutS2
MRSATNPNRGLDPFSRETLELQSVIEMLRGDLTGPIAEPLLDELEPRSDVALLSRAFALVREALEYRRASARPGLGNLKDPRPLLDKVAIEGVSLAALEILAVVQVARAARDLHAVFTRSPFPHLDELLRSVADFRPLLAELEGKILPDGWIDSSASPELARIRRSIERLRAELQTTLERLVRRLGQEKILQDAVVTLRNDRYVIPVRVEEKRRVAGVVHGASSSGATVFLEPMETVPMNNELVELQDGEYAEIQRILGVFSGRLRERLGDLRAATEILSELDLAFAKAEFSRSYDGCLPQFVPERALLLREVRHPLLERTLRAQKRRSVPLTVELAAPKTLMVVSGPNTGGKTVAVKTVGLAVLMAQAGLPVLADEARLPRFGKVLADIGDQQSIEANLSTFSAHVTNIEEMAKAADGQDLVLLDELGASTEPNEGAALGVAILEHFRARGAMTFVTTHHSRLKAYAAGTPEAVNAAMEFDEATLQPTYRLLMGLPGKSSALEIAERLGLEPSIVAAARGLLDPADAEAATLLAQLHELKSEFESARAGLHKEQKELEVRRVEWEEEFRRERRAKLKELDGRLEETLRQFARKWQETVAELRRQLDAAKVSRRAERKGAALGQELREEWNAQVLETLGATTGEEPVVVETPPAVGDRVRVANLSMPGKVIELLADGQLEVEVGRLRMRLRAEDVRVLASGGEPPAARVAPAATAPRPAAENLQEESPAEINVIGATAEEACERVDKFLDQAFLDGRFRLRVVHGHGKGILRKALHEMFATHPHVEKFYPAPPHEGGTGATIVDLKM